MSATDIVQVKRLARRSTSCAHRLAALGIDDQLGVDDVVDPDGAARARRSRSPTARRGDAHRRQPVRGAADGGLGRRRRRAPDRPRAPPVAPLRRERLPSSSGAVKPSPCGRDGRANPHQLVIDDDRPSTSPRCARARRRARRRARTDDGWSSGCSSPTRAAGRGPTGAPQPRIAYHHPLLDARVGADADRRCCPTTTSTSSSTTYVDAAVLARRRRVRLRRRQALPRLPAARAARRASTGRAATAATFEQPHRVPAPRRRGHPRRVRRARASACACRPSTSCRSSADADGVGVPERRRGRVPRTRSAATAPGLGIDLTEAHGSSTCAASSASGSCASPPAARTTTRTSSGRRSSRRPTATSRPRTRSSASPGMLAATAELTARASRPRRRRLGLLVPPGVAAQRRAGAWCARGGAAIGRPRPR